MAATAGAGVGAGGRVGANADVGAVESEVRVAEA